MKLSVTKAVRVAAGVLTANLGTTVLLFVLAASLSINVWLGRAELNRRQAPALGRIQIDSTLPDIALVALDGRKTSFKSAWSRETLVYVLSPSCGWCTANHSNIVALGKHVSDDYRVIGLSASGSIEDLRAHLLTQPLPFDVFLIDRELAGDLPLLDATPMTLFIDRSGQIKRAWMGAFIDIRQSQIEATFNLRLPGLTSAPGSAVP